MATVTRLVGDLDIAEDAVQDACALAVERWPAEGTPANPRAWLIGVARHKAIDRLRREAHLLRRLDRRAAAAAAYRTALELEPAPAEQAFIRSRLD